ncbi:mannose-1-phosphate guanylyltransferase [Rhizobium rhizosphaerae]|uniref:Mannose-1-phosphate guanylyltransferase n=1 Tax=Xaviernesmea rhizosphaerae TaxID=1672749 RepID=A0ABX3PDW7_9HYPH|nr:nucleotidyltransferase family protein [Xaviernesmea rhizosphaerae]OQP86215.1 mannose-1-phosphate guanylyltransferase [Xaviernesmea rhizosphaerae]
MVLAAGLGTRLRPITETMPKPLVPISGRPMIDHVLDLLVEAGIETAVVNVHHFADRMEAHLATRAAPAIRISDEREGLMNSGGGLAKGLRLLSDPLVMVMNADLFWVGEDPREPSNLSRLSAFFDAQAMDMAMLVVPLARTTGHNGRNDFSLLPDGRLVRYREDLGAGVVYAGAFVLRRALFDDAPEGAFNLNVIFDRVIDSGRLFGLVMSGEWITVGTPEAIAEAEATIARCAAVAGTETPAGT